MRPGDLTTGAARLHLAWKTLMAHWDQTRPEWNDSVSREFEEQYLAALSRR